MSTRHRFKPMSMLQFQLQLSLSMPSPHIRHQSETAPLYSAISRPKPYRQNVLSGTNHIILFCARDVFLKDLADFDTLIFCILRQVLDMSFRALFITNTGDTSVYCSCYHIYQRRYRTTSLISQ